MDFQAPERVTARCSKILHKDQQYYVHGAKTGKDSERDKVMFAEMKLFIIVIIKLRDSESPDRSAASEIIC